MITAHMVTTFVLSFLCTSFLFLWRRERANVLRLKVLLNAYYGTFGSSSRML